MSYTTVLFDLDGTLLNTLADLCSAVNRVLDAYALPRRTIEEVRRFVGNGIKNLIDRAAPDGTPGKTKAQLLADFKVDYAAHCTDDTVPYDGVLDLLGELKAAGIQTAIVSNKADFAVGLLVKKYFDGLVTVSRGERPDTPKKPAPDMLYAVMNELGAEKETTLFVGDSDVDCITAKNAGLDVVLVDWGFRDREILLELANEYPDSLRAAVVSSTEELKDRILR